MAENTLYYGDNLDILKRYVASESVDLIYLDPPFNSKADYNVLFQEKSGEQAASQIMAFEDTWHWDKASAAAFHRIIMEGGRLSKPMQGFQNIIGHNDILAYLAMMAPRLLDLHRVLKPTGSIYLHCDPTASHYLKLLMDATFGPANFRNEIVWKRADPKGHAFSRFPSTHDIILFYVKGDKSTWNSQHRDYDPSYLKSHYSSVEEGTGRQYTLSDCTNPNKNRPNLTYEWNGVTKVWRWTKERMQQNHDEGRLVYTKSGSPRYKRYLDEMPGTPITTIWDDIPFVNSQAAERLGYPTQKPTALLERIVSASSNEGDTVLDPFCGCGTSIAAAQNLKRRWIGIDVTYLAITLIKGRLKDAFGKKVEKAFEVIGEPVSLPDAEKLAAENPYQFQFWSLGLVGARPVEQKKGADKGIDGRLYFEDNGGGKIGQVIFSVKAGHTGPAHVRDLLGVVQTESAAIGVLITMKDPTPAMRSAAASAGVYESSWMKKEYPKLQILTIEDLLGGKGIDMPPISQTSVTFKRAPRAKGKGQSQGTLDFPEQEA